ncbi:SAM-dependent methyltransferase [Saccharopolyspora sp. 5N708]|uniref:SAM-dependent methyltransferase n=1 Tax=Saccharopolyspora sp. 5N708 TaxID=3457424 RepID=UPI003FCF166F
MSEQDPFLPQGVDLSRPSVARVYDWYLGGNANWAIDREFGQRVLAEFPLLRPIAIANRLFLHRAVRQLRKQGIRQFIDIGSGVPTMGNTHAVADEAAPDARVVYVDNEPVAVAHSQTLLEQHGDPARHAVINADLRNPELLWQRAIETGVLDFEEPIALLFIAVLHVMQPGPDGTDISPTVLTRYRELLTPGSYLAISHITDDGVPEQISGKLVELKKLYDTASSPVIWRSRTQIGELFGDFQLMEPGMTWTPLWHSEDSSPNSPEIDFRTPEESVIWAGVGRKP